MVRSRQESWKPRLKRSTAIIQSFWYFIKFEKFWNLFFLKRYNIIQTFEFWIFEKTYLNKTSLSKLEKLGIFVHIF